MIAANHTTAELQLPALQMRALARRASVPALAGAAAIAAALLAQSHVHALADGVRRVLGVSPAWAAAAVALECASLAGYVALLSLVAGRAAPRVGVRESAQITLAGAAATRLLPTAGAGGVALALWALREAGLRTRTAARTLLAFLVLLYSVFLAAIVLSGALLALDLAGNRGPGEIGAAAAIAAGLAIALALVLASRTTAASPAQDADTSANPTLPRRIAAGATLLGAAVRDALSLLRTRDVRLAGAVAYWALDAAVLWAMLHAFGSPPALAVVMLAYFVGQLANTLPVPGSVSGGIAGVLIAFGVSPALALPSVLAYRTIAVWLPTPAAIAAIPALRATIANWRRGGAITTAPA
jgi:putative heme transporter